MWRRFGKERTEVSEQTAEQAAGPIFFSSGVSAEYVQPYGWQVDGTEQDLRIAVERGVWSDVPELRSVLVRKYQAALKEFQF